jgi:hypothetical protein
MRRSTLFHRCSRSLRGLSRPAILVGLAAVAVGAPLGSSAASCPALVHHFDVSLPSSPFSAEVGTEFTVTVTAKSSCNEPVSSYRGPATLSASGTDANGDPIANGAAGVANLALKFKAGTGTATQSLTATTDSLAVKLTATDTSVAPAITGTSASFNVYDDLVPCGAADCSGSISSGPTGTHVTVTISGAGVPGSLGLSLSGHHLDLPGGCLRSDGTTVGGDDVPTMGSLYTIAPPAGLAKGATFTVTVRYSKEESPGTGVSNFVHCMSVDPSTAAFEQVPNCAKKNPQPACISDQRRNGVGELVVTFLLAVDPVGGGFG